MELKTTIIQASVRGNKEKGIPNQDYIMVYENRDFLIAAVSDGLGSSKNSLKGAKVACMTVINVVKNFRISTDLTLLNKRIKEKWLNAIKDEADSVNNYRTTNSFIAVYKNEKKIIIGQLGDVLISLRIDGLFRYFESIIKDFSNETDCLGCGRDEKFKLAIYDFGHSFDFLIATDGIGDELLSEKIEALHDYLITKYQNIKETNRRESLKKEIVEFINQKNNDDKSLIFVWTNKNT